MVLSYATIRARLHIDRCHLLKFSYPTLLSFYPKFDIPDPHPRTLTSLVIKGIFVNN